MTAGFVYVLSNPSMPGLVEVGRTINTPETRVRELAATGVPADFVVEYPLAVSDCVDAEREAHLKLEALGLRYRVNREFFVATVEQCRAVIEAVAASQLTGVASRPVGAVLLAAFSSITLPDYADRLDEQATHTFERRLTPLGEQGLPLAYKALADITERNCPNGVKFREYSMLNLSSEKKRIQENRVLSSRESRLQLGRNAAEYLESLEYRGWLMPPDLQSIQAFLVSGDAVIYSGYIETVERPSFSPTLRQRAADL